MRICRAVVLLLCASAASLSRADDTFPYKAFVNADEVYVRSGPGKNYYPTDKLIRGTELEVYRHDPGGWYAIRPPQESFSWIQGRNLRLVPNRDRIFEVVGERVIAFVGSRFSDVRDVRQVHLDRGELVQVLGEKRFLADGSVTAETWYKVAPPAGEFRWVFGRFVAREGGTAAPPVRSTATAAENPATPIVPDRKQRAEIAAVSAQMTGDEAARPAVRTAEFVETQTAAPVRQAATFLPVVNSIADNSRRTAAARIIADARGADVRAAGEAREVITIEEPASAAAAHPPDTLQVELDDINLKLSLMIAEEPTVWQFDALRGRANAVLNSAQTALQRGRANSVLREIQQYETIRRQYVEMAALRQQTDRQNQLLAETAAAAADKVANPAADLTKYDGVGRLTPVASKHPGAPRYALTDGSGGVVTFVTPTADLPLQSYVGHVVGLSGVRGFLPNLGKPHLTANRLTELNPSVLR